MMDKILILDFGSQFTQLIGRRIRELQTYCEILAFDTPIDKIVAGKPKGIILSGGQNSVYDGRYLIDPQILKMGIPILGICYGMQLIAHITGGKVLPSEKHEYGNTQIKIQNCELFEGLGEKLNVLMSHGDVVTKLAPNFSIIATSKDALAAFCDDKKRIYALQFHPEVSRTENGIIILDNFIEICAVNRNWTMGNYISKACENIKERVGNDKVILALSGGVDSSVAATLIHRAIGDQLTCIFVDHGLLRLNEAQLVMNSINANLGVKVIKIDAKERFLRSLSGVSDPEQKRKIIGSEFIEVFKEEGSKLNSSKWLAQGTIYSDIIESSISGKSHTIKSHHNVGGLPGALNLKFLEPLRELFKDEVRHLGIELGLNADLVYRHPFPGPGLAIRIVGEIKDEYISILQHADDIFIQELRTNFSSNNSWYELTSQAFAVFLPLKSVGVMGDRRTYENMIVLRCVQSTDFMTADWSRLPFELLDKVSNRIINEVRGIGRVLYDISGKPPATIEYE